MLIKGENGGFSLDEGKSAEQVRFFSKELCGADFNQRSVTVVGFGSRPVKKARLLSDTDDPVNEVQVTSFDRRGLSQGDFLEESNGNIGGISQARQGDGPISESTSVVTNGLRSRNAGMKVGDPIHASEHVQNGVNTKTVSKQKSGAQEDEKRGLLNHGNMNGNAGCTTHSMLEDTDDTTSNSEGEELFVIQVRSPTSKQLLHGEKQRNDQKELHSCNGEVRSNTAEPHDLPHNPDMVHNREDGCNVGDAQNTKLDAEKVESSVGVANAKLVGADDKLFTFRDTEDRFVKIQAPDLRSKDVNGVIDDQQSDGSPRHRSDAQHTKRADANEHYNNGSIDGSNLVYSGLPRNAIKESETSDMEGLVTRQIQRSTPHVLEFVPSHMENSEVVQETSAVGLSDAGREEEAGVNSSEVLNVYVRKRKRSSSAEVTTSVDSVPLKEHGSSQLEELVDERVVKHYVRRLHRQADCHSPAEMIEKLSVTTSSSNGGKEAANFTQAEHHIDASVRVESEGNFNVFERRSKTNQLSRAENRADEFASKTDVPRIESEGNPNVFQRRSETDQLPEAEHHVDVSARVETQGKFNVFQRRSKMNQLPRAEHHTEISGRVENEGNLIVFQRRSKMNHSSQADHADVSTSKAYVTGVESESKGNLNVFQRRSKSNQLPEPEQHTDTSARVECRSKMNHVSQPEHHADVSTPKVENEGNLNVFQRRSKKNQLPEPEHHVEVSARVETETKLNVFQRRSKKHLSQKEPNRNDSIAQNEKHTPEGYVRADNQPNWLPEGWTLEIREGKTTAHLRDKYYHDNKSGRIFRSKNEVLQFLGDERVGGGQIMSHGNDMNVQSQNKKRPVQIAPAKETEFRSPFKLCVSTQTGPVFQATPSTSFTLTHPACMKTSPIRPNGANGTGITMGEQCQGGMPGDSAGATALHGGTTNSSQLLSFGDGIQLSTGSPESPSDQGDKENRGKLIFRLKRKQPDSEGSNMKSKRPMYEVVHGEKASSSTPPPTNQEKLNTGDTTGQYVSPTPGSVQMLLQRISSVKESLSPNIVSSFMPVPVKAQVEKHIPLEKPSFISPSPLVMLTVDRTSDQSVAPSFKVTSFESSGEVHDSTSKDHSTMSNWGIKRNPLHHPSQHLGLMQQEPYTALGIPAQARHSGLQQIPSYSANHTHVYLDPIDNTIPLSWQYPFATQASTPGSASVPTLGPFPSTAPSVPKIFSGTGPTPSFDHYPGVPPLKNSNGTATMFPGSESGVDSGPRDLASNAKLAEGGPHVHKVLKVLKPLSKADHTKLFLDLGRRLCLAGIERTKKARNPESLATLKPLLESQKTRNPESLATLKSLLESQIPVTNMEGKSLQQGSLQTTPRMQ